VAEDLKGVIPRQEFIALAAPGSAPLAEKTASIKNVVTSMLAVDFILSVAIILRRELLMIREQARE
jgi:hypothetical protein